MTKLVFTSYGYNLAGNLFKAKKPGKLAFLLIQGWAGHQHTDAALVLAELGFTCLTYDMRGNRESEGNLAEFSRADFINDAVVAYDFLKQHVGPDTQIGVIGSSFGSYTAVLLSERRKVYCLSLRVPANYPDEGFNEPQLAQKEKSNDFREWRSREMSYTENHALKALHNFDGKVQIIEAENDELVNGQVPKNYAASIKDKTQLTYAVMAGAPHSLIIKALQEESKALLTSWAKTL